MRTIIDTLEHSLTSESTLTEGRVDLSTLGEITGGPLLYLHYTVDDAAVRSIQAKGFDLKRFGATGKRYRMAELTQHDPKGVYATAFDGVHVDRTRPFVIFSLPAGAQVLGRGEGEHSDLQKEALVNAYGCVGAKLTQQLLRDGVQVVHAGFEFIILNPALIRIERTSLTSP